MTLVDVLANLALGVAASILYAAGGRVVRSALKKKKF